MVQFFLLNVHRINRITSCVMDTTAKTTIDMKIVIGSLNANSYPKLRSCVMYCDYQPILWTGSGIIALILTVLMACAIAAP